MSVIALTSNVRPGGTRQGVPKTMVVGRKSVRNARGGMSFVVRVFNRWNARKRKSHPIPGCCHRV